MININREPDRIELRKIRQPEIQGGEIIVFETTILPLPAGAGVHRLMSPQGELIVDMSFARINPANPEPHVILRSIGEAVRIDLQNGRGRVERGPDRDVIFDASRLHNDLVTMNRQEQAARHRGW